MNEQTGVHMRVGLTGLSMSEYFRDEKTRRSVVYGQCFPFYRSWF